MTHLDKVAYYIIAVVLMMSSCYPTADNDSKPNVIFILADDLGYGELGSYGQTKIETPNIDRLAANGMRFTQYYTGSPVCAPSRCILLTGQHSGHADIRGNDEANDRGDVWNYRAMFHNPHLEGQAPMTDSIRTIAHELQNAGYNTSLFGKWGLGHPGSNSLPNNMGFDHFVGYNCQRQAHTLTPLHLWCNEERIFLNNDTLPPRTKLNDGEDPYDLSSYGRYDQPDYAPTIIFDSLISHIGNNKSNPFALFWETPIPHVPLQAPQRWVNHYVEKFGDEKPYLGDKGYFPCRYPNATYAAMISYFDENVGKLVDYLKEYDLYDNTLIMISSDNGPTYAGGVDPDYFNSAGPFKQEYGWGKGFLREGGIRVPLIASWPAKIAIGQTSDHISCSQDIYPTIAEVVGIDISDHLIDGISLLPTLTNTLQEEHDYLYWEYPEYGGQRALRMGNYKFYQKDMHKGNTEIALFDISIDIKEQHDISAEHPDLLVLANELFEKEHVVSRNSKWHFSLID